MGFFPGEPNKLFTAFSVYTNGWKLYDVTINNAPNNIKCLHGIRSLSILYIIFGHRFGANMGLLMNFPAYHDWTLNIHSAVFHTHQVPVDVFFMMGGLLATWSILQSLDKLVTFLERSLRSLHEILFMILESV